MRGSAKPLLIGSTPIAASKRPPFVWRFFDNFKNSASMFLGCLKAVGKAGRASVVRKNKHPEVTHPNANTGPFSGTRNRAFRHPLSVLSPNNPISPALIMGVRRVFALPRRAVRFLYRKKRKNHGVWPKQLT